MTPSPEKVLIRDECNMELLQVRIESLLRWVLTVWNEEDIKNYREVIIVSEEFAAMQQAVELKSRGGRLFRTFPGRSQCFVLCDGSMAQIVNMESRQTVARRAQNSRSISAAQRTYHRLLYRAVVRFYLLREVHRGITCAAFSAMDNFRELSKDEAKAAYSKIYWKRKLKVGQRMCSSPVLICSMMLVLLNSLLENARQTTNNR